MKTLLVVPALLFVALSVVGVSAFAQTTPASTPAPAAAPGAQSSGPLMVKNPISAALRDIMPARVSNTVAAVEAMPADKFNYKPTPDQITFGHLVAHMINANYLLCSKGAAVPATSAPPAKDMDDKEKLVAELKVSFDFCTDAINKMDDSKLGEITEGGPQGQEVSRARFALGIASNWADHYAEAAMYLRLNGILPPTAPKKDEKK